MTSFIKINIGDKVFDSSQSIEGIVTAIDYSTNVASLTTGSPSEDESILCKLANLTVIKQANQSKKKTESEGVSLEISIKYFNQKSTKLSKLTQGDWIDLRASETTSLKAGEFKLIPLGVAMRLPDGHEAIVAPRSSTFKNFGVVETNSIGVIDNSYSGSDDQWFFPAYAMRDTTINFDERICQFRIQKRMPEVSFVERDALDKENRGGHGSTGVD